MYCVINELEYQEIQCPYAVEAYRGEVREFIFKTQEKQPMLCYNIVPGQDKLLASMKETKPSQKMKNCDECGNATSGNLCKTCWLKQLLEG